MNTDEKFMKRAIELSRLAVRHRNDPFGAVLVTDILQGESKEVLAAYFGK